MTSTLHANTSTIQGSAYKYEANGQLMDNQMAAFVLETLQPGLPWPLPNEQPSSRFYSHRIIARNIPLFNAPIISSQNHPSLVIRPAPTSIVEHPFKVASCSVFFSLSYRTIAESSRYGLCSEGHAIPLSDSIHKIACILKIVRGNGFDSVKCWLAWQSSGKTKDFCPSVILLTVPGDPGKAHPRLSDWTLVLIRLGHR